jgi:hypothetical protein
MTKVCPKCGGIKTPRVIHRKDGRVEANHRCFPCDKKYNQGWRTRNASRYRELTERWRVQNADRYRDLSIAWNNNNRGKVTQSQLAWKKRNPDTVKKYDAEYHKRSTANIDDAYVRQRLQHIGIVSASDEVVELKRQQIRIFREVKKITKEIENESTRSHI